MSFTVSHQLWLRSELQDSTGLHPVQIKRQLFGQNEQSGCVQEDAWEGLLSSCGGVEQEAAGGSMNPPSLVHQRGFANWLP